MLFALLNWLSFLPISPTLQEKASIDWSDTEILQKGKQLDFWEREWYIQKLPRNDKKLYEGAKTLVTYKNSFNIHTEARMTKNKENRRCKEGKKTNSQSIKKLIPKVLNV